MQLGVCRGRGIRQQLVKPVGFRLRTVVDYRADKIVVVQRVLQISDYKLFLGGDAACLSSLAPDFMQCRQKKSSQNGDDRNGYQKLYKREGLVFQGNS